MKEIIKALNEIDHIWLIFFVFILMMIFWSFTHASFIEKISEAFATALITAAVVNRTRKRTNAKPEDSK
jgi:hypothetical protein